MKFVSYLSINKICPLAAATINKEAKIFIDCNMGNNGSHSHNTRPSKPNKQTNKQHTYLQKESGRAGLWKKIKQAEDKEIKTTQIDEYEEDELIPCNKVFNFSQKGFKYLKAFLQIVAPSSSL